MAFLKETAGSDILARIVSDIVISALPSKADAKNDYVYQAPDQNFYRVLLVKHSVYGNKRRELILNFVRTLDKVQSGDNNTTTLVAAIMIGSKYRSIFIKNDAKYSLNKLRALDTDTLASEIADLLHDIERINADAAADGFADYEALQQLLGNTNEVKELFDRWH